MSTNYPPTNKKVKEYELHTLRLSKHAPNLPTFVLRQVKSKVPDAKCYIATLIASDIQEVPLYGLLDLIDLDSPYLIREIFKGTPRYGRCTFSPIHPYKNLKQPYKRFKTLIDEYKRNLLLESL